MATTGEVMLGQVPTIEPKLSGEFSELMSWADEFRKLKVRTNADTPADEKGARTGRGGYRTLPDGTYVL